MARGADPHAMAVDDLGDLPGVDPDAAAGLREAGFEAVPEVAYAPPEAVAAAAGVGAERARAIVDAARDAGGYRSGTDLLAGGEGRDRLSVGVPAVDDLLGGGVPPGAITEVSGPPGAGKSQVVHQLAVTAQLPPEHGGLGGSALVVDTEGGFRPERVRDVVRGLPDAAMAATMADRGIAGDPGDDEAVTTLATDALERIRVAAAASSAHQILLTERAADLVAAGAGDDVPVRLVCVDSVTARFRADYAGDARLQERQQQLTRQLHDLRRIAAVHDVAVVVTNQVATDPEAPGRDATGPIGGNVLGHACAVRFALAAAEDDERTVRLVDAPDRPPGEAALRIGPDGLGPA